MPDEPSDAGEAKPETNGDNTDVDAAIADETLAEELLPGDADGDPALVVDATGAQAPPIGALLTKLSQLQHDAGELSAEGSAGGGMVVVTVSGRGEVLSVKIERDIVDPDDVQMLEDLVRAAVNAAVRNAQSKMREGLAEMAMGLGLPPGLLR